MNSKGTRGISVCRVHRQIFRQATGQRSDVAFTRVELLIVSATLALLVLISLPLAARQQSVSTRSEQLVCMANLRHIGRAYQLWASDHDDQNPYLLDPNQGGIRGVAVANNIWYQFAWLSNELATPKVLVCPSDTNILRIARDFSFSADGGFLNPAYRNNAVSYFLSLHAFRDNPHAILAGDRNLQASSTGGACSYSGLSSVSTLQAFGGLPSNALWSNSLHGVQGNVLFNDRDVRTTSSIEMWNAVAGTSTDAQRLHFITPR